MDCLDILTENMARANIDIAIDCLKNLLKKGPRELNINTPEYFSKLNSFTKFIYLKVWSDRLPAKTVKQKIIPLLEKAHEKITVEEKHYQDFKTSVRYRVGSLRHRYLNGLEPCLPAWVLKEIGLPEILSSS